MLADEVLFDRKDGHASAGRSSADTFIIVTESGMLTASNKGSIPNKAFIPGPTDNCYLRELAGT